MPTEASLLQHQVARNLFPQFRWDRRCAALDEIIRPEMVGVLGSKPDARSVIQPADRLTRHPAPPPQTTP